MALIKGLIPNNNFEVIRDQIGAILLLELTEQLTFATDPEDIDLLTVIITNIFAERTSPFENDEVAIINIQLSEGSYDNENVDSSDGSYDYFIDINTSAKAKTDGTRADSRSKFRLQRLIGFTRSILKNSSYVRLGNDTPPPIIQGVTIPRFQIAAPENLQDAASISMARVTFRVRANEKTELIQPNELNEYHTQVQLEETDKGFRYENVATP